MKLAVVKVSEGADRSKSKIIDIDDVGDLYNIAVEATEEDPNNPILSEILDDECFFELIIGFYKEPCKDGVEGYIHIDDD